MRVLQDELARSFLSEEASLGWCGWHHSLRGECLLGSKRDDSCTVGRGLRIVPVTMCRAVLSCTAIRHKIKTEMRSAGSALRAPRWFSGRMMVWTIIDPENLSLSSGALLWVLTINLMFYSAHLLVTESAAFQVKVLWLHSFIHVILHRWVFRIG